MKKSSKLQLRKSLQNNPFFTKSYDQFTEQDKLDSKEHDRLRHEIENDCKKLKKGDKVTFNFPDKIRDKSATFGYRFIDNFREGIVKQPVKLSKRTRMGEDCSVEIIKVTCGNYIYPCSLYDVEKL
jgi:hypothetical protein